MKWRNVDLGRQKAGLWFGLGVKEETAKGHEGMFFFRGWWKWSMIGGWQTINLNEWILYKIYATKAANSQTSAAVSQASWYRSPSSHDLSEASLASSQEPRDCDPSPCTQGYSGFFQWLSDQSWADVGDMIQSSHLLLGTVLMVPVDFLGTPLWTLWNPG